MHDSMRGQLTAVKCYTSEIHAQYFYKFTPMVFRHMHELYSRGCWQQGQTGLYATVPSRRVPCILTGGCLCAYATF